VAFPLARRGGQYVAASADGYVVGEELEGDYLQDWQEEFGGLGDLDGGLD